MVVRSDGETEPPVEYRGPNAAEHFLRSLKAEEQKIKNALAYPKAMRMTGDDWQAYRAATVCYVCKKPLWATLSAITVTSQVSTEEPPTMRAA